MAIQSLGDVRIIYPDNLTPNQAVAVTQFRDGFMQIINVKEFDNNVLAGLLRVERIAGRSLSIPRALGVSSGRVIETGALTDRTFNASETDFMRVTYRYNILDIDFAVKDDESNESRIHIIRDFMRRIKGVHARYGVQVVLDALNAVPVANSSVRAQDGVLKVVDSRVKYNPTSKKAEFDTGDAAGWNQQKLWAIRMAAQKANAAGSYMGAVILAAPETIHGFASDEQTTNMDYMAISGGGMPMGMGQYGGYNWFPLGEFPDALDGSKQGITFEEATVNEKTVQLSKEYVFDRDEVILTTSATEPMHQVEIYRDENTHSMRFRYSCYLGAGVLNPKGVILVRNAASAFFTS